MKMAIDFEKLQRDALYAYNEAARLGNSSLPKTMGEHAQFLATQVEALRVIVDAQGVLDRQEEKAQQKQPTQYGAVVPG
jgi:hypothetical protein